MRFGTARNITLRGLVVFSTVLALALAQQPQPPIRVQVNEVVVPVTVTDEKGRFVSDLEQADFKIFDQGKEQTIRYFNRERNQRVVVGFLVDLSNQSRGQWKSLQEAAIELVLNLLPGDKKYAGYLIGYGNEAELMVNTTSDADPIVEKLRKISPSGGSAFYDAAVHGLHQPQAGGRRARGSAPGDRGDRRRP